MSAFALSLMILIMHREMQPANPPKFSRRKEEKTVDLPEEKDSTHSGRRLLPICERFRRRMPRKYKGNLAVLWRTALRLRERILLCESRALCAVPSAEEEKKQTDKQCEEEQKRGKVDCQNHRALCQISHILE